MGKAYPKNVPYSEKKHDILLAVIQEIMGDKVQIHGHQAGLHILLEIMDGQQDESLVQKALSYGVELPGITILVGKKKI